MITVRQICHYRDTFSSGIRLPAFGGSHGCGAPISPLRQSLKFMHAHNLARRDACRGNMIMMMDSIRAIPNGYHFSAPWSDGGYGFGVHWQARASVSPVDYYSIDFGLSDYCPEGPEGTLSLGIFGQDKTVPELSDTVPCVDIYQLGNGFVDLIKVRIVLFIGYFAVTPTTDQKYTSMAHFESLAASLTRLNPDERPSAYEALTSFETICSAISSPDLAGRLYLWSPSSDDSDSEISGAGNSDYELVLASGSSGNHLADPHESVLKDVNSLTISDE
ncbi:hypothetical protein B0H10DRAFT_2101664 [Mycena sp. CBHHK59/15]|nr:hypothetical protein B0H10DRAFT_2101664 [Mycena sp. CBHHK59/15]